jgi:hypothetical protein
MQNHLEGEGGSLGAPKDLTAASAHPRATRIPDGSGKPSPGSGKS